MNPQDDIIAAIVTPIGEGGISVVRVSGRGAVEFSCQRFRGKSPLAQAASHTAHFGLFTDRNGDIIDEVVSTVFKAPHSYTAEDTVEFSCHGGMYISRRILGSLIESGARPAEPGEFTRRAFLNGRIDLSQAEAVADLICSRSERSHRVSVAQLQGKLSGKIADLRENLLNLCSLLELELDFSEEGIELADKSNINNSLASVIREITGLIDSYTQGRLYRDGVRVALVGRPNVGKSSILNTLLSDNRAIVTDIPGTTRDTIQESLIIDGLLFSVIDTAGLRKSEDKVELEGMLRTKQEADQADIVAFISEPDDKLIHEDLQGLSSLRNGGSGQRGCIVVVNKIDLKPDWRVKVPNGGGDIPTVYTSVKTGFGFERLRSCMVELSCQGSASGTESSPMITNERHARSLINARECLVRAQEDSVEGKSNEFIAINLRQAMDSLGEVIGLVTNEEVLNNIFARFCIGK